MAEELKRAVGIVLEGWTLPDDVRKILEAAYWAATPAPADRVPMPTNADQAAAMALLGEAWLRENAPERLKAATPAPAPQDEREEFEAWAREYSTYPLERDDEPAFGTTGYTSMEQTMLWDAWQARAEKAKAPEGASGSDLDANARPGLAGANGTCRHEFALSPSSGILLCAKCGIGEVAANKQARAALAATPAPAPQAKPLTDEHIGALVHDSAFPVPMGLIWPIRAGVWGPTTKMRQIVRAIERAHGIGKEASNAD